ncbi:radical SAM protein [Granulicella arctica]|uniref:radical SAM protein n=1 Tax=Granulicella arctica TaxID=940613 RepID=UPI0021E072D7|nr:radical SAM protein [Granulicella arctica]
MIRYSTVGLLYTRTCPLACRHCIIESSPKATEKMTQALASEYIKVVPKYSDQLCFTGGEPLLYYNEILPLIRQAKELGLGVSLVTGAGWVTLAKPHIARERIRLIKEAGLDALVVSWDSYHEEFSPPENALLVVESAKEVGLSVQVRGVMSATGPLPRIEQKLVSIDVKYQKQNILRLGSAATLPEDHFIFGGIPKTGGCGTIFQPVVEPDGKVYACCGPSRSSRSETSPLILGDTAHESLDSIFERATNDPILEAIATIGPHALFNLIKDDPELVGVLPIRERYTGICELCLDMNDVPAVVNKLRARVSESQVSRLITALRLYHQSSPELRAEVQCPM